MWAEAGALRSGRWQAVVPPLKRAPRLSAKCLLPPSALCRASGPGCWALGGVSVCPGRPWSCLGVSGGGLHSVSGNSTAPTSRRGCADGTLGLWGARRHCAIGWLGPRPQPTLSVLVGRPAGPGALPADPGFRVSSVHPKPRARPAMCSAGAVHPEEPSWAGTRQPQGQGQEPGGDRGRALGPVFGCPGNP